MDGKGAAALNVTVQVYVCTNEKNIGARSVQLLKVLVHSRFTLFFPQAILIDLAPLRLFLFK